MDHLQFEAMLFDVKHLTSAQRAELESHLASCSACGELAHALSQMEERMANASLVAPAEGFGVRFQRRLWRARQNAHARLFGLSAVTITAGVVTLVTLFGADVISWLTPLVSTSLKSLAGITRLSGLFTMLGEFLTLLVENMISTLPPAYLLAGSAAFSGLLGLWILSLYRMNIQSVRKE
jgi:anti-sigma factor RsiW